jgi:integrase/recombinase XerD
MMLRIERGKSDVDREVPISQKLLETLREYWRWMRPNPYMFPGTADGWRADKPITSKAVWQAVQYATTRAGFDKRVSPHTLRHASAYYTTFQSSFILKTIGPDRARSAGVYGHRAGPPSPVAVPPVMTNSFSR